MKKSIHIIIAATLLTIIGCTPAVQVPAGIAEAVSVVATGNGFQPREPHFLLEQYVPEASGNKKQRAQMAALLLEALASPQTTAEGRTVIAQYLSQVAGDGEHKALKKMLGNPETDADIRIALGETSPPAVKKESIEVYQAEIKSADPVKQIAGISALALWYPESAPALCIELIGSDHYQVYATAIRLLSQLDQQALSAAFPGMSPGNQQKMLRVVREQQIPVDLPVGKPVVYGNTGAAKKVLLVTGLEYPSHPWQETAPALANFLKADNRLEISYIEDPRILAQPELANYDVIVLNYQNHNVPAPEGAIDNLSKVIKGGKGLVLVHFACGAFIDWETKTVDPKFAEIAGRVWNPELRGHDPRGKFRVKYTSLAHPVTSGLSDFDTDDELYTCLDGTAPIEVLATAKSIVDQKDYPMAFVLQPGSGRTFHCVLGHDLKALNEPTGELYLRGTLWAAGLK
jgi:uncharacterized protein